VRDLESHLRDKDKELLTIYRRSTEHDQELLRHHSLLWEAEEATATKAHELEEFQATKDQEITQLQEELPDYDEEVQERDFELVNRNKEIDNLQAQIH
jgi:hypothetical protein